jgi:hypothetical protein
MHITHIHERTRVIELVSLTILEGLSKLKEVIELLLHWDSVIASLTLPRYLDLLGLEVIRLFLPISECNIESWISTIVEMTIFI